MLRNYNSVLCMWSVDMFFVPHINKRNKNKLPYVFTEQGGGMLSALLKSEIAGLKYYKNRGRE